MEKHDIVVVPSLGNEGFGRVAHEASIAGRYVISSNIGGLRESTFGNYAMFEVNDVKGLAKRIEEYKIKRKHVPNRSIQKAKILQLYLKNED